MLLLLFLLSSLLRWTADNQPYLECRPLSYTCGGLSINISYPFQIDSRPDYCGHPAYSIVCANDSAFVTTISNREYSVLAIDYSSRHVSVTDAGFFGNSCPRPTRNTTVDLTLYEYTDLDKAVFLLMNCTLPREVLPGLLNLSCDAGNTTFYTVDVNSSGVGEMCESVVQLVMHQAVVDLLVKNEVGFGSALLQGFTLKWTADDGWCEQCVASGGRCGYITNHPSQDTCFCASGSCSEAGRSSLDKKVVIANRYSDLKKITKSFSEKLGQGGYGTVYKGELPDGRLVAVKVLSDSKGNGDEFVNEVASIGRTSHVNVVSLLGFSSKGAKRALIYEFMLNGSLEKYIYLENMKSMLGWEKLYQIAVSIARGLEYLHRGCNAHIVHFDIKPHNILLDQDFCPKISDFGLAKLCPKKDSVFSTIDARGTIGYIAPEVFSRSFGSVSSKSDVYSYGMMVLEMVGGRNKPLPASGSSSESYFPHWIYEHFHQISHVGCLNVTEEMEEIVKKMVFVGLWCIQPKPGSRPSMSKVVDMLESSLDDLEMPPKPYFWSP